MKLLIVDDEYHVIKAVKFLVSLSSLGITQIFEAGSAPEAIAIIEKERPEILITDVVMQDFTGIDLMEYLNNTTIPIKVIVISGFNNFDYIRAALQNGGVDYLLKPIDADQLEQAVKKAVAEWKREDEQRRQTIEHMEMISSMSIICKETMLYRILTHRSSEKYGQELFKIIPRLTACETCMVGYYDSLYYQPDQTSPAYQALLTACGEINDFLEERNSGFCFFSPDDGREVVVFLYHSCFQNVRILVKRIQEISKRLHLPLTFGFGLEVSFPADAHISYEQAVRAYKEQDVSHAICPVILYDPAFATLSLSGQDEAWRQLFTALITSNEKLIDESIDMWIHLYFPREGYPLYYVLEVLENCNRVMERWQAELKKYYPNLVLSPGVPLTYHQMLNENDRFSLVMLKKQMRLEISRLIRELTSPQTNPKHDVIYQVEYYLRLNYDKPFSQFACAQLFYINKNYMCRKFKNTFQTSMVSYLTEIRVNHAKELLENPDIRVRDIANLVGFEDEKYFSRQFHKVMGMSPNEYRQRLETEKTE